MHEVFPDGRFDRLEYAIRKVGATGDSMGHWGATLQNNDW
jgi:hypothetical protein